MDSCIFCDIISKKQPTDLFYEDNDFVVFKDIKPLAPVHFLIAPKKHIASINDLKKGHKDLMGKMILLAKKIAKELGISEGYKLAFNTGRKGGQLIDHIHLHLMGGWGEYQE